MAGELNCRLCNKEAAVRVHGTAMCSSCAVASTGGVAVRPPGTPRLQRVPRAVVLGAITAFVAVFGATATAMTVIDSPVPPVSAAPATPTSTSQPVEPVGGGTALPSSGQFTEEPAGSDDLVVDVAPASSQDVVAFATAASDRANELAEAMQSWAGCVSQSASTHSSIDFDLTKTCGPQPRPSDYGLTPFSTPPGQANKDNPNTTTTPPGQANKDNPSTTPPGQANKDDPNTTPPGQANKDDPNTTPPGQANKDDPTN